MIYETTQKREQHCVPSVEFVLCKAYTTHNMYSLFNIKRCVSLIYYTPLKMSTAFPIFPPTSGSVCLNLFASCDLSVGNLNDINHMLFYPFKTITVLIDSLIFVMIKRKR